MATRSWAVVTLLIGSMATLPVAMADEIPDGPACYWPAGGALNGDLPLVADAATSRFASSGGVVNMRNAVVAFCRDNPPTDPTPPCPGGLPVYGNADASGNGELSVHNGLSNTPREIGLNLPVWVDGRNYVYVLICIITVDYVLYMKQMVETCAAEFIQHMSHAELVLCLDQGIDDAPPPY